MGISLPPDKPFHLQLPAEKWEAILRQAIMDHRKNPHDDEALQAVKDANEALNAYDQPTIEAGEHTTKSGWGDPLEAVKGEAEGGLDALLYPFHAINKVYRQGPAALVDEMVEGIKGIPGEIKSGDPRRIGRVAGNVAGGIATGKGIGKMTSKVGGALSDLADRPGLKNNLLRGQIARTNQSTASAKELSEQRAQQAPLRTELLRGKVNQTPLNTALLEAKKALAENSVDQIPRKNMRSTLQGMFENLFDKNKVKMDEGKLGQVPKQNELLDQSIERGDPTLENLNLRNELLRRKLEGDEGEEGGSGAPNPDAPPPDILDPRNQPQKDFGNMDPYGLNDLPKPATPPDPNGPSMSDWLTKFNTEDAAPHDMLNPDDRGLRPLTPEEINQLLNDATKKKPPQS